MAVSPTAVGTVAPETGALSDSVRTVATGIAASAAATGTGPTAMEAFSKTTATASMAA